MNCNAINISSDVVPDLFWHFALKFTNFWQFVTSGYSTSLNNYMWIIPTAFFKRNIIISLHVNVYFFYWILWRLYNLLDFRISYSPFGFLSITDLIFKDMLVQFLEYTLVVLIVICDFPFDRNISSGIIWLYKYLISRLLKDRTVHQ